MGNINLTELCLYLTERDFLDLDFFFFVTDISFEEILDTFLEHLNLSQLRATLPNFLIKIDSNSLASELWIRTIGRKVTEKGQFVPKNLCALRAFFRFVGK